MTDNLFTKRWFRILFKGILILLFAIFTLLKIYYKPFGLAYIFGALMVFNGLLVVMHALRQKDEIKYWWVLMLEGIVDVGFGICMLLFPNAAILFILVVLGAWALFSLIYSFIFNYRSRNKYFNYIYYILSFIILIIIVAYFIGLPIIDRENKIFLLGIATLVVGLNIINLALELKTKLRNEPEEEYI